MIWHVVTKDLRLLWPLAAGVAILQLLAGMVPPPFLHATPQPYVAFAVGCAQALLLIQATQNDLVISPRQDWLTRPIPRHDMLFAKLLFAFLTVQIPVFVSVLLSGMMPTLPLSIDGALSATVHSFITISLPVIMVAALTRNSLQALTVLFFGVGARLIFFAWLGFNGFNPDPGPVIQWLLSATRNQWQFTDIPEALLALLAAFIILPLQYFRRNSRIVMASLVIFFLAYWAIPFMPWRDILIVSRQALSLRSTSAVSATYNPQLSKFLTQQVAGGSHTIYLPLRISGLPKNALLQTEGYGLQLIDASGAVLYRDYFENFGTGSYSGGDDNGDGSEMPYIHQAGGAIYTHQQLAIPADLYNHILGKPVRIQVTYDLVLLKQNQTGAIGLPAGSRQTIAGLGSCLSEGYNGSGSVGIRCINPESKSQCEVHFVENVLTRQRNDSDESCDPDLVPALLRWLTAALSPSNGIVVGIFGTAEIGYPITSSQVGQSQAVVTTYEPAAFFRLSVKSPLLHLDDLDPICEKPGPAPQNPQTRNPNDLAMFKQLSDENDRAEKNYTNCLDVYGHGTPRKPGM